MSDRIRLTGRESPLELIKAANTLDLFDVLDDLFSIRLPRELKSGKMPCPFGFEHPDGGMERTFRTYPESNHAYCFADHGFLDPVRLVQLKEDISATAAARKLLQRYNALAPMPYWERFAEVERARHQRRNEVGDPSYAVEALRVSLQPHPAFLRGQYAPSYTEALGRALDVLNAISSRQPDNADELMRQWFDRSKRLLTSVLDQLSTDSEHATLVTIPTAPDEGEH